MARINGLLNNFTGGEISPKLRSRTDLDGFYRSTEYQKNFISDPQGELRFRSGTQFAATGITQQNLGTRILPFVGDADDSYFLELSNGPTYDLMRVFLSNGGIYNIDNETIVGVEKRLDEVVFHINAGTVGNWTVTNSVHALSVGNAGYTQYNFESVLPKAVNVSAFGGANREIVYDKPGTTVSAAEAAVGTSTTNATLYSEYTVTQPFTSGLTALQWVQKNNIMFIVDGGSTDMQSLAKTAGPTFAFTTHPIVDSGGANFLRTGSGGSEGKPISVAFHEGRLWVGGSTGNPDTVWGSAVGNYDTFDFGAGSPTDSTGVTFTLAANNDTITHLASTKDFLYIQTSGGGHYLDGGAPGVPITYQNFNYRLIHNVGSKKELPVLVVDEDIFFVERTGIKLRQLDYNFDRNKYIPVDLGKHNDKLTRNGLTRISFSRGITDTIYLVSNSGDSIALTYDLLTGTNAWSRYVPGVNGEYQTDKLISDLGTEPRDRILDCVSIPSDTSYRQDTTMFLVERGGRSFLEARSAQEDYILDEDIFTGNKDDDKLRLDGDRFEGQIGDIYFDSSIRNFAYGTQNLTFSSASIGTATVTAGGAMFASTDVGRRILALRSNKGLSTKRAFGIATITAYTSSTVVTVDIQEAFAGTTLNLSEYYFEFSTFSILTFGFAAGNKIGVVVDGTDLGDFTIPSTGLINIPYRASSYIWGYRYNGIIKSVNLQGGGTVGPSDNKIKNVTEVGVQFRETKNCRVGTNLYNTEEITFARDTDDMNRPTPLFTGEKTVHFKEKPNREKHIYILKDDAGPCNVQALVPYMEVSND